MKNRAFSAPHSTAYSCVIENRNADSQVLEASASDNLRRDLGSLFFPKNVLEPAQTLIARNTRYLDYRPLTGEAQAASDQSKVRMLAGAVRDLAGA